MVWCGGGRVDGRVDGRVVDPSLTSHLNPSSSVHRDRRPTPAQHMMGMNGRIAGEKHFNDRRREFLNHNARTSVVADIVAMQDPQGRPFKPGADKLFPQDTSKGANPHFHTSLLALTKNLMVSCADEHEVQPMYQVHGYHKIFCLRSRIPLPLGNSRRTLVPTLTPLFNLKSFTVLFSTLSRRRMRGLLIPRCRGRGSGRAWRRAGRARREAGG